MINSATGSDLPSGMSKLTNLAWLRFRDEYRHVSSLNAEWGQLRCLHLEPTQALLEMLENNLSITMLTGLRAFHYEWQGTYHRDNALLPLAAEVQSRCQSFIILDKNHAYG